MGNPVAGRPDAAFEVRRVPVESTRALRRAVLRPHQGLEQMAASEPPEAVAFGAFRDGSLVAVGLVGPDGEEPGSWRVRGMATDPDERGRGAGGAVLAALVGHAVGQGARRIWCQARIRALTLYERQGFRAVSAIFELPEIGPHVTMERVSPPGVEPGSTA